MRTAFLIVLGACVLAGVVYGILDIIAPTLTIKWQIASTARSNGLRHEIGAAFGRWINADGSEPWNEPAARRRVRVIGIVLIGSMVAIGMGLLAAASRS